MVLPHLDSQKSINNWYFFSRCYDDFLSKRIYHWCIFFHRVFTEHSIRNYKIQGKLLFEHSLNALIALSQDDILVQQTSYEFHLSKQFYEYVLSTDNLIYFQDAEQAKYFLKMSLIFSVYPGFVSQSIIGNSKLLNPNATIAQQALFFKNVFSRYENVCSLMLFKNLHHMNGKDIRVFMQLLAGKSLRKIENLMPAFSKRQCHALLHCLSEQFSIPNNVFFNGWFYSKLFIVYPDVNYFNRFLGATRIKDQNHALFIREFEFFEQMYRWLSSNREALELRNSFGNRYTHETEIVDFFLYIKQVEERSICFKGRTIESVCNRAEEWHDQFDLYHRITPEDLKAKWGSDHAEIWKYEKDGVLYEIEEIKNGETLLQESEIHSHCVFSYVRYCKEETSRIYRMSKGLQDELKPCLTIEVKERSIVQVGGKYNRKAMSKEIEILRKWAKDLGLLLDFITVNIL